MDLHQASPADGARVGGTTWSVRLVWITALIVVLAPIAALVAYYLLRFGGLTYCDALDFAQIGRNLTSGRGFTTYILRPLALAHGAVPTRQPDVVHGPLHPFLLALMFGILGAKDNAASLVSGILYLITVPLVYRLGKQMFSIPVARVGALVFALHPLMLDYATSGLHVSLAILLSTWLFLTLFSLLEFTSNRTTQGLPRGLLISAGVATGLLYLTDPIFVWIVPCVSGAVVWRLAPRAVPAAILFGVSLGVLILPWMVRNALLTGNPVFGLRGAEVWMGTRVYPGTVGWRMLPGDLAPTGDLFQAFLNKLLVGINMILHGLPEMASNWLLAFFLPSLLFRFKDPVVGSLRAIGLIFFASLCLGMLVFNIQYPLIFCLLPVVALCSVAYLFHLVEQARLTGMGLVVTYTVVAGATLYPLFGELALTERSHPLPVAASARLLARQSEPGDTCVSDQPWIVAWYADRPTLWIPAQDEKMGEAVKRVGGVRWLFLTEQTRVFSPSWQYVYDTLEDWNTICRQSRESGAVPPARLVIDGGGQPLMDALDGFTSVEPSDEMATNVVVARAQPRQQDARVRARPLRYATVAKGRRSL